MKEKICDICGNSGHLKATCRQSMPGAYAQQAAPMPFQNVQGASGGCHCCGKTGHKKSECPMKDKSCDICGAVGHLKSTCRQTGAGPGGQAPGGPAGHWVYAGNESSPYQDRPVSADSCLCCGKTGHRKADCPMKDKACDICGNVGHLKSTCRQAAGPPGAYVQQSLAPSRSVGGQAQVGADNCLCCGKTGHRKADCPMKDKPCDICGRLGHLKSTCRQGGGGGGGGQQMGSCHCCGQTGHVKAECPMQDKTCDACGKTGHLKATCRQAPTGSNPVPPWKRQRMM